MIVEKLKIKNFRSFGPDITTLFLRDLSVLIGANSSGKTAAIQALLKLFGTSQRERTIQRADFHVPYEQNPSDMEESHLSIEAIIRFPELIHDDEGNVKKTIPPHFRHLTIEEEGQPPYLRIRLDAHWLKGNTPEGEIEQTLSYVQTPEGTDEEDSHLTRVLPHQRASIQLMYVPATRDPDAQLRNVSGTILSRILKGINWPKDMNQHLRDELRAVEDMIERVPGVSVIRDILKSQWGLYHKDQRYSNAEIVFNGSDLDAILKKTEVTFEPTETPNKYTVEQLGDGLRSVFYLSLVSCLLKIEDHALQEMATGLEQSRAFTITPPSLTILAVEEPENHVAPHLLGRIISNLKSISHNPNSQVIISTHTPALVKRVDPESIVHLRMSPQTQTSVANGIHLPDSSAGEVYKYIKTAVQAYPEMYFSRLVILGEGDSEEIVIPYLVELLGTNLDASGISVVPLGGRHVHHIWKLLHQLDIPFLTLLDLDRERYGGGWGRIKYVLKELLQNDVSADRLLHVSGRRDMITLADIENMHIWAVTDVAHMDEWVRHLENFGIYFAYPLDLDFMMLQAFPNAYQSAIDRGYGPRIPDRDVAPDLFKNKVLAGVRQTLKSNGGDGDTYTQDERELMIWYSYLFLSRGKPGTHLMAMSLIELSQFSDMLPEPLKRLQNEIEAYSRVQ